MESVKSSIEEVLAKREPRPSKRKWRGSLLGGCIRAHWYDANGVPETEPFDDKLYGVFKVGNMFGEEIVKMLSESEAISSLEAEVPVEIDDMDFAGNIDALVTWKSGKVSLLEFKSESANARKYRGGEPKKEHLVQAASYGVALRRAGKKVDDVRVVYFDKDSFTPDEYLVPDEWGERALRILRVMNYYGDRTPPRIPEEVASNGKGGWKYPCSYCRWKTECRGSR